MKRMICAWVAFVLMLSCAAAEDDYYAEYVRTHTTDDDGRIVLKVDMEEDVLELKVLWLQIDDGEKLSSVDYLNAISMTSAITNEAMRARSSDDPKLAKAGELLFDSWYVFSRYAEDASWDATKDIAIRYLISIECMKIYWTEVRRMTLPDEVGAAMKAAHENVQNGRASEQDREIAALYQEAQKEVVEIGRRVRAETEKENGGNRPNYREALEGLTREYGRAMRDLSMDDIELEKVSYWLVMIEDSAYTKLNRIE